MKWIIDSGAYVGVLVLVAYVVGRVEAYLKRKLFGDEF